MTVTAPPAPAVRRSALAIAGAPAVLAYLGALAALAVIVAGAPGAEGAVAGTARAAAVGWLAVHQVPLMVDGAPLGVLPLLPTLALGVLVARSAAAVASRAGLHRPDDAALVAGAIGAVHAVLGAALAVTATPATVTADPVAAALGCGVLAAGAAVCGLAGPCGVRAVLRRRLPGWARRGLVGGALSLGVLLAGGAAVVLGALVASRAAVRDLVGVWGPGAGAAAGVTALSIAYLPDAAVAGVTWLCGSGFGLGAGSVGPLAVTPGEVPAVPLVAALPTGAATGWWAVATVVPLGAGVLAGRRCRLLGPVDRARAVLLAGATAGSGAAALALVVGGRVGAGPVDPVDLRPVPLAIAVLVVTAVPAAVVSVLPPPGASGRGRPRVAGRVEDRGLTGRVEDRGLTGRVEDRGVSDLRADDADDGSGLVGGEASGPDGGGAPPGVAGVPPVPAAVPGAGGAAGQEDASPVVEEPAVDPPDPPDPAATGGDGAR